MKKKVVEVSISEVYRDIIVQRDREIRTYTYSKSREETLKKYLRFVGNFAASQCYASK